MVVQAERLLNVYGGGAFICVVQDYQYLDLKPLSIEPI
jgi:hypothetical protein